MGNIVFSLLCLVGLIVFMYFHYNREMPIWLITVVLVGLWLALDLITMLLGDWVVIALLIFTVVANIIVKIENRKDK